MHTRKCPVIYYGWFIVAAGMAIYALGYGSRYSFSVIFPSLLDEFGWGRSTTAVILSLHLLVYGLTAPLAGFLVDRVGPRKTMVTGVILLASGLAVSGKGTEPWHFFLSFGVLSGTGLCLIGGVPFTTVLRNWFERKRGLVFSLLFFGNGGAFACFPIIAFLIKNLGWRTTFFIEALVVAGFMLPVIILVVRYHPREKGLVSDGIPQTMGVSPATKIEAPRVLNQAWADTNWTLLRAAKTRRFWFLCLSTFSLWGISQHIMLTHQIAFAVDLGHSKIYASSVLSLFGIFFSLGALAGLLSDRIGREATITISTFIGVSGIIVLSFAKDTAHPWMLYYYAMAFGFSLGMTSPTIAASATDIFQGTKVGPIIGFVWFSFACGGFIGPWLGGLIFEITGAYRGAFIAAIVLCVISCAAIWLASPRKIRLVPGQARIRKQAQDV